MRTFLNLGVGLTSQEAFYTPSANTHTYTNTNEKKNTNLWKVYLNIVLFGM